MSVALLIYQNPGFNSNVTMTQHLFVTRAEADAVFEQVHAACKAYHERANDREKFVNFLCVNGPTAVDVSCIITIGVDDPMEETANAALKDWHRCVAEIRAVGNEFKSNSQPRDD